MRECPEDEKIVALMKEKRKKIFCVKLPAHSAGLPGNDLLFKSVPLDTRPLGRACGARSGHADTSKVAATHTLALGGD